MVSSFTGSVRLHSILLRTTQDRCAPKTLKLFTNKVGILEPVVAAPSLFLEVWNMPEDVGPQMPCLAANA